MYRTAARRRAGGSRAGPARPAPQTRAGIESAGGAASIESAALREYLAGVSRRRTEQGRERPSDAECDATYTALGLGGYDSASQGWSERAFERQAGGVLGSWVYETASGSPAEYAAAPGVVRAYFLEHTEDDAALAALEAADRYWGSLGTAAGDRDYGRDATLLRDCLATGVTPSPEYRSEYVASRTAREVAARAAGREERAAATAASAIGYCVMSPSGGGLLCSEAVPPRYLLQPIVGDGACFYRALANALVHAVSGLNLGRGVAFPTRGAVSTGESYPPGTPINRVVLNGVAQWVRFYVSLVTCSDVPVEDITYEGGVAGVPGVCPVTSVIDLLDLWAPVLRRGDGEVGEGEESDVEEEGEGEEEEEEGRPGASRIPGTVTVVTGRSRRRGRARTRKANGGCPSGALAVPSLDAVVRYAVLLTQTIGASDAPTLEWGELEPFVGPLLSPPIGEGPFARPRAFPIERAVPVLDRDAGTWNEAPLAVLLRSSDVFAQMADYDEDAAYAAYCGSLGQRGCWGGSSESVAFAALFRESSVPFYGVVIYKPRDDEFNVAVPVEEREGPAASGSDGRLPLSILLTGKHYESLLPSSSQAVTPGSALDAVRGAGADRDLPDEALRFSSAIEPRIPLGVPLPLPAAPPGSSSSSYPAAPPSLAPSPFLLPPPASPLRPAPYATRAAVPPRPGRARAPFVPPRQRTLAQMFAPSSGQ